MQQLKTEDDLISAARDLVRWFDHAGCGEPEMLQARVEVLRRALGLATPEKRKAGTLEVALEILGASRKAHSMVSLTPAQAEAVLGRLGDATAIAERLEVEVERLAAALEAADRRALQREDKVAEGEAEVKRLTAVGARLAVQLEEAEAAQRVAVRTAQEAEEAAVVDVAAIIRRAEVAERTLDDVTHSRDAALRLAESRFDCHGGPGTATMGCGACISCLTSRLIAAEAEDGRLRVEREGQIRELRAAEQARDEAKAKATALESRVCELEAMLEATSDALEGKPVSDFMESFPIVMRAGDMRRFADAWEQATEERAKTAAAQAATPTALGKIIGGEVVGVKYSLMLDIAQQRLAQIERLAEEWEQDAERPSGSEWLVGYRTARISDARALRAALATDAQDDATD